MSNATIRTILNRFTNAVLWEGEAETVKDALHAAIASGANLSGADLSRADLSRADLSRADLSRADLSGADLSGADLSGADLSGASLLWANLSGANLGVPSIWLIASWGEVSPELCALLMRHDAANHPKGVEAFDAWKDNGACPYSGMRIQRVATFTQQRELWNPDAPVLSAFDLMVRLIREKCADSDYHDKKKGAA
jgi:hypothetical protein